MASLVVTIPPIIFEKLTFYYYSIASPTFGFYSGYRLWFDIIWFCIAGAVAALVVGRHTKASVLPALLGAFLFALTIYLAPLCSVVECYISSTDGLGAIRDFFLFASLAAITSSAAMKSWGDSRYHRVNAAFQLSITGLIGFALSFFPVMHIFAGVSADYPINYLQWFLAGAPAGLAGSMWILDRGTLAGAAPMLFAGLSGVILAIGLAVELPCDDCSGYPISVTSIILLAALFCVPAILLDRDKIKKSFRQSRILQRKAPAIITTLTIVVTIALLLSFFFTGSYQMSVVNSFSGVANSRFSDLEVGRTFVYSAGYLAAPRVVSQSVGINISFGNTSVPNVTYPANFLTAGVGDQSPNCCKDGLDLSYRADVIEFSNGSEALLARAWWACDYIMACGGYSWQQLLHFSTTPLPAGALSNWVELRMNWTNTHDIQWFYRIHFLRNGSLTQWLVYESFTPPQIQNHYWDAGLFGGGNVPLGWAFFYQFGVSSAYPIASRTWQVFVQCPNIVLNGTRTCISKASYINGQHSFWKTVYTFGATYSGMTFTYLGNHEVEFYYSGHSPEDETVIWE
jgi:hypothetical protein